jgi:hypothetical protein
VRLLLFRSSSQVWAELHEKAFRRECLPHGEAHVVEGVEWMVTFG